MVTFADVVYNTTPIYEKYENGVVELFIRMPTWADVILAIIGAVIVSGALVLIMRMIEKNNKLYPTKPTQEQPQRVKSEYSSSYTEGAK